MAKRGRESFEKRAREKARLERQEAKRARRLTEESSEEAAGPTRDEEDDLMGQFARLSARFEAKEITAEQYAEERQRIFGELGIEDGS